MLILVFSEKYQRYLITLFVIKPFSQNALKLQIIRLNSKTNLNKTSTTGGDWIKRNVTGPLFKKELHVQFTTVPFKPLFQQNDEKVHVIFRDKFRKTRISSS